MGGSRAPAASARNFYGLSLGYRVGELAAGERGNDGPDIEGVRLAKWRLVGVHQTSLDAARKTSNTNERVNKKKKKKTPTYKHMYCWVSL